MPSIVSNRNECDVTTNLSHDVGWAGILLPIKPAASRSLFVPADPKEGGGRSNRMAELVRLNSADKIVSVDSLEAEGVVPRWRWRAS